MVAPLVGAALVSGAAGLAGGLMSSRSSARQAQKQMDFQERMSNTAYQRAAADLEAAGLNRVLALGAPASTPGGAMGQVPNFGSAMAEGANVGVNLASSASAIQKQQAEINKIVQETKNLTESEKQLVVKSELYQTLGPILTQAGKDFSELMKITREMAPEVFEALKNTSAEATSATMEVLSEFYGTSVTNVSDWFEQINDFYQQNKGGLIGRHLNNLRGR